MKNPDLKKLKKSIKKMNPILKEFRDFINRGNVIDLAVGVIIGGAFNKIISSLVNDLIMPVVSILPISKSPSLTSLADLVQPTFAMETSSKMS